MKELIKKFLNHESLPFQIYFNLKFLFARFLYGSANDIQVLAVTGTNGKSTCANLLYQSLLKLDQKVALISTVNVAINEDLHSNLKKMTSLDIFDLYKFLKLCRSKDIKYLVLEYSSHAYIQKRLKGLNFRQINLTSLMKDHVEYHGSLEKYWQVKFDIINSVLKTKSCRFFYNENTKNLHQISGHIYGVNNSISKNEISDVDYRINGTSFNLNGLKINSELISSFNLNNILGVYYQLLDLDFQESEVLKAISELKRVKGRFEYYESSKVNVVLDYAHSEDSLENILKFYKTESDKAITLVFGCTGGGRDVQKRPRMGMVADFYADSIILTSDDPYFDDPYMICDDISQGIVNKSKVKVEVDRRKAIELALDNSTKNDLVVIVGKAGEDVMAVNGKLLPFSDIDIVKKYIHDNK